ncbi:uncharacterized protein MCYG_02936 [Microsporum canis CBS 113480]|uniref:Uncharacterized protein n=1 Tax=Arthroderma otae (strain ATCC MYA-4605 / CBS 113480) TaxID=554155 RepID=C5FK95_ARTOC|nr:uncharacterized protein MCYG_02936 [Microsporum canis CBS 113480]EEQ30117.1 predicted protein [Microsporum canis CBS 113480]
MTKEQKEERQFAPPTLSRLPMLWQSPVQTAQKRAVHRTVRRNAVVTYECPKDTKCDREKEEHKDNIGLTRLMFLIGVWTNHLIDYSQLNELSEAKPTKKTSSIGRQTQGRTAFHDDAAQRSHGQKTSQRGSTRPIPPISRHP